MKILVAGDFCPRYRVADSFEYGDYESVLGEVKDIISDADYSIVNFECPVTKGGEKPITKYGPNLQCSERGVEAVKWSGFDCVTLANNHFLDYSDDGVNNSLMAFNRYKLDYVGGGMNLYEAARILYKQIGGRTLAIINCCEHEFSIATETHCGSNPLNPIQQYYAIKEAKCKADYVLVIVHGGHEHYQLPSPRMQEIFRFFIDAGADAVINHHQHCFSGYETYQGKLIFYGLGNFCFDYETNHTNTWRYGFMVTIDFETMDFEIEPYDQCSDTPTVKLLNDKQRDLFDIKVRELNQTISDRKALKSEFDIFLKNSNDLKVAFSPWRDRITMGLCRRGLLPSLLNKSKATIMLSHIQCEAHYDRVIHYLREAIIAK